MSETYQQSMADIIFRMKVTQDCGNSVTESYKDSI